MKLNVIRKVDGLQVHYADDQRCLASKRLTILQSRDNGASWEKLVRLPTNLVKRCLLHFSLYSRLIRGGIHAVLPIWGDQAIDCIAVAERRIYCVSPTYHQVKPFFRIERGRRPLRRGLCVMESKLFMGEYWMNPNREPVNIYSIDPSTGEGEILYQFTKGRVRHIHVVEPDPYTDSLCVATGDTDAECMICWLDVSKKQTQPIGYGSQKWRTVSLVFRSNAIYWGTDNHLGENKIWRFDRATGTTSALGDVVCPVYYSTSLDDYAIFGTTMEKGEGDQDGFGRLYAVDADDTVEEVWRAKKDRWDARLFGYGVFEFAEGHLSGNRFWVTAKGFEGGLQSLLFELKDE